MAQKSNLPFLQSTQKQKTQINVFPMPENTDFLDEIIEWASKNNVPDCKLNDVEGISRDKERLFKTNMLVLFGNKLPDIPSSICKLINLSFLDLSDNKLTSIPGSIGDLTNLQSLNLSGNKLVKLPESIGMLKNLKDLWLENNQLTELPESIGNLINLTELHLENSDGAEWEQVNTLSTLPESIGNLKNLTSLQLYNNELTELPKSIGNLTNLVSLHLRNNRLTEIPESIKNLTKLSELNLRNNCLTQIPDSVQKMRKLKILGLEKQLPQINVLPKKIEMKKNYQQKILFGSPGTGKSYQIDKHIIPYELLIDVEKMPANVIKTVFHPEYTYGDFVGKLMPITVGGNVQYKFYEGHFLKALSQAYKNIIAAQENDSEVEKVALVIDEINRGNSAAIFGTIFQLLDRNPNGWSSYEVSVNEIIFNRLFELCDLKEHSIVQKKIKTYKFGDEEIEAMTLQKKLNCHFENRTIKIPPNLSILASMNTSDSSIYYMDSAFKRRWEWEFIDVDSNTISAEGVAFENRVEWQAFVSKLNAFIKSNHKSIRGIEDKQIGHFFITDDVIQKSSIQNKLMFFLWDSVFNRDKKPLVTLLFGDDKENELITFGDFATQVDLFIEKINER